jgi:hypothetical protein
MDMVGSAKTIGRNVMDHEHGRFSVDEIRELFTLFTEISNTTRLSSEDQAKLDTLKAKLDANDPAVAEALKPKP